MIKSSKLLTVLWDACWGWRRVLGEVYPWVEYHHPSRECYSCDHRENAKRNTFDTRSDSTVKPEMKEEEGRGIIVISTDQLRGNLVCTTSYF